MTTVPALINDRWTLQLLPHREEFHRVRPNWEGSRLAHMVEHTEPGWTVYDVGAEEGDFTALYKQWVGPEGIVVPFEPQPAYWPAIRQTWEANGYDWPGHWFGGFASDTDDREPNLTAFDQIHGRWPRCSRGPVKPDFGFRHLAQQADSTPETRLDTWAQDEGIWPDIIVMDIEGAELRALQGCSMILERKRAHHLYVSLHNETGKAWYGWEPDDIHNYMAQFGYRAELLGTNGEDYWVYSC